MHTLIISLYESNPKYLSNNTQMIYLHTYLHQKYLQTHLYWKKYLSPHRPRPEIGSPTTEWHQQASKYHYIQLEQKFKKKSNIKNRQHKLPSLKYALYVLQFFRCPLYNSFWIVIPISNDEIMNRSISVNFKDLLLRVRTPLYDRLKQVVTNGQVSISRD